jgi:hypothetical protein
VFLTIMQGMVEFWILLRNAGFKRG